MTLPGARAICIVFLLWITTPAMPAASQGGKLYAVVVGISNYQDRAVGWLQFADRDARLLERHLKSERGGAIEDLSILINTEATQAKGS